jgi:hypothetical protein
MIRRSGAGLTIQAWRGFGRATRLPVVGSFMKRCRFHTRSPTYSRLRSIPVSRSALPRISDAGHWPPRAPATDSAFSFLPIARGDWPPM